MSEDRTQRAQSVLQGMMEGLSLRRSCIENRVPLGTFLGWVDADPALADQYARARAILIEHMAEDTLDIADEAVGTTDNGGTDSGAVAKQRLQVETRKWLLSKLAPKKYGDKITQEVTGANGGPILTRDVSELSDEALAAIINGQPS